MPPPLFGARCMAPQPRVLATDAVDDLARGVVGAVVDDDELVAVGGVVERQERLDEALDHQLLVAAGHEHGDERSIAEVEADARAHVARRGRERRRGEREMTEQEHQEDHEQPDDDHAARGLHAERAVEHRGEAREREQRPGGAGRPGVARGLRAHVTSGAPGWSDGCART